MTTLDTLPRIELAEIPDLDAVIPCPGIWEGDSCGRPQEWRFLTHCVCGELCWYTGCGVHKIAFIRYHAEGAFWTTCCQVPLPAGTWNRL